MSCSRSARVVCRIGSTLLIRKGSMIVFMQSGAGCRFGRRTVQSVDDRVDQPLHQNVAVHPRKVRMQDEQGSEPVDGGPERLAGGFYIVGGEDPEFNARPEALAHVIERLLAHGVAPHTTIRLGERLELEQESHAVIVRIFETEFDLGSQASLHAFKRVGRGSVDGGQAGFQLLKGLFAYAVEQVRLVLKMKVNGGR